MNNGAKIGAKIVSNMKWINNGNTETMIDKNSDIPNGYILGRLPHSKERKSNMSTKNKRKRWWTNGTISKFSETCPDGYSHGRAKFTEEAKENMRKSMIGKRHSEETKHKMSKSAKTRWSTN